MTTTTRSRAAGPGPDSGRSAPYGRPRTDRTHPPTATGTATAPSDKVCSFQLPQVCSFRLPLTRSPIRGSGATLVSAQTRRDVGPDHRADQRQGAQAVPHSPASGRLPRPEDRSALRLPDQQLQSGGEDHRGHLQGPLAGRAVLQVDQTESAHQEFRRRLAQRSHDADLDRRVRPSAARLPEIRQQDVVDHALR